MLLRTRINLIVTLVLCTICAAIIFAGFQRENLFEEQFSREMVVDQTNLWVKINGEFVQRMESRGLPVVLEHEELIEAVANNEREEIQRLGADVFSTLSKMGVVDRFEVIMPDGSLGFSSHTSFFQSPVIISSTAQDLIELDLSVSGIGNDKDRNTTIVYGVPLHTGEGEVVGFGVLAVDIVDAIREMELITNSAVMFVNRRGRLIAATSENEWLDFQGEVSLKQLNVLQTFNIDDQAYSATVLPLTSELAGLVGRLVIIKDITELHAQQEVISRYTAIAFFSFLIIVIAGLNYYMSHSFAPLTEVVNVLRALSKGDMKVQVGQSARDDEVGQITKAVSVFRANLVTLNRFSRSRARQRARQQRFIFREMTELADTLDGDEREAVLDELRQLGTRVERKKADRGNDVESVDKIETDNETGQVLDSLAMMALAFQNMSTRVQDQHQRLVDALATKEALIALRNELDIATRVQLSLIPDDLEISDTYIAAGFMVPAKEVGGDFYDYFRLDEDYVAVAVADVAGKGVPAALFMAMTRTLLRSTVRHIKSPGKVLEYMNSYLERNNKEQLFVTMLYGILNEKTGVLTYSTGGHQAPILSDSKGTRLLPQSDGMLLAMISDIDFDDRSVELEPGSRLFMMTDGIPESFNAEEEEFGEQSTLETVANTSAKSPQQDVDEIIGAVNDFVGEAPQFDDMTLIVLQYQA